MIELNVLTQARYTKQLCAVLAFPAKHAVSEANLRPPGAPKSGRFPSLSKESLQTLEARVNEKMARAESAESSLGERIELARDIKGWNNADIARKMGVSRELVRCWKIGKNQPSNPSLLAEILEVPEAWLTFGGAKYLPADSHLGRLVGNDMMARREALYGKTQVLISNLPDEFSEVAIQQAIEAAVHAEAKLSVLARQAGGRWQCIEGQLRFAPWIAPKPLPGLQRRYWTDQVEAMIAEELAEHRSIYAAWHALKARCIACELPYPTKISLYKRHEKRRQREDKQGIRFHLDSR